MYLFHEIVYMKNENPVIFEFKSRFIIWKNEMGYSNCVDFSPGGWWWRHGCGCAACFTSPCECSVPPQMIPKLGDPQIRGAGTPNDSQKFKSTVQDEFFDTKHDTFLQNTITPPKINPRFMRRKRLIENGVKRSIFILLTCDRVFFVPL